MIYIQIAVRGAILMVSLYGYMCAISKHIKVELIPGLLFSAIGGFLFAAGILNILQEAAWMIWAGGIYFFIRSIKERIRVKEILTPGILFWGFLAVVFLLVLYKSEFYQYDDFTHWGVAAKVVCQCDHFPNAADQNIGYQSYVLGSTCFIYFITEIIGIHPEWLQLWAQAILTAGMAVSLFAFCKNKTSVFAAMIGILMLLCSNIEFVGLLVDTLLPLTGFAALAFCVYYKDTITEKMYFVIPYIVFLVGIKSSGALFVLFAMLFVFFCMEKHKETYQKWLKVAACPAVVIYFWKQHVEQCFPYADETPHSMTLTHFSKSVSEKTWADVMLVVQNFFTRVFSESDAVILLLVCFFALWFFARKRDNVRGREIGILATVVGVTFVVYQFGLLGTYLFSMIREEAIKLASFDRYHKSIMIYITAILLMTLFMVMTTEKTVWKRIANIMLSAIILAASWNSLSPNLTYYQRQNLESTDRSRFDYLIEEYRIDSGKTYMIIVSDERDDGGYLIHLTNYLLAPEEQKMYKASELPDASLKDCDYVIVFEETEASGKFMAETYGTDAPVVRIESEN